MESRTAPSDVVHMRLSPAAQQAVASLKVDPGTGALQLPKKTLDVPSDGFVEHKVGMKPTKRSW